MPDINQFLGTYGRPLVFRAGSCPNEGTAAQVPLLLEGNGFKDVHPLLGGIDAWGKENYPVVVTSTLDLDPANFETTTPDRVGKSSHSPNQ
jgi:hypothetical protein